MLSPEMNERLTSVGPGTPGGELMRRYWIPIAPAAQLLEDPVRKVRILGEDLTLYKDKSGQLGLIGERCAHRLVDLQWGIPDEHGLRCPYHGWRYDETGQCTDTPLEAADSSFKERINIGGYPVQEMGGLIFAYMGPLPAPLLPPWDLFVWPNAVRQIGVTVIDCNWLQCQENTGDPTHGVWLHGYLFQYVLEKLGEEQRLRDLGDGFVKNGVGIKGLYAHNTEYGMEKGVVFSKELGAERDYRSRHSTVIFPFYTEQNAAGAPWSEFQIRVPIDDTHTYHISYGCYAAPPGIEAPKQDVIPYYEVPIWDENGKPVLDCILNQDFIAWWSQGALVDRSKEKLGRTDTPVIFLRRQLADQIKVVEDGGEPMNVFRDPAAMPEILFGGGNPSNEWVAPDWATRARFTGNNNRLNYHKGGAERESDRYGAAVPLVAELHRRIEEAQKRGAVTV
ncbi:MAG: Rieske (2Fe-2S) protein [Dehalococcoidia bacterium]|nr:Rieske (2Fe-2S) protein [Dehalococcoidia bacterium]